MCASYLSVMGELIQVNHPIRTASVIIDRLDFSGIKSPAREQALAITLRGYVSK